MNLAEIKESEQANTSFTSESAVAGIPLQKASEDIWDKKYRLKDKCGNAVDRTIEDTYTRVAGALARVEEPGKRDFWRERFVWALEHGAIPAGRIISNAGAAEHKPATSTINCTVSGQIPDSMNGILSMVHEAGLTLKAGCVAPGTLVYTEQGLVTADRAVAEKHERILSYDRDHGRFELRCIERHMTTHVPRAENIEIVAGCASIKTSVAHPVLVCRDDRLQYVRADDVRADDALIQHSFPWTADRAQSLEAWFAGAHLGDGSAYEKQFTYKKTRNSWAARAKANGKRLIFKIRAAEREVVERYAAFFRAFCGSQARVVAGHTYNGTPVWDFTVASFGASKAAELIDHQTGKKSGALFVPAWIAQHPESFFLPFLAGLIDTDGTVSKERGSAILATQCEQFAHEIKSLLGLFDVRAGITRRKPRSHEYHGHVIHDDGGFMVKISDSDFLQQVAEFMADSGKRRRIREHASQSGQYDRFVMSTALREALQREIDGLSHLDRQKLGFYHGYHQARVVSRIWLKRWQQSFPHLHKLIAFVRTLRPVDSIKRNLDLPETFFDFSVEKHNNYLAGNNGLVVIHNCGIGYEFSTLRPRGAYVSGAGAYTSGPLSFMDIFDKMCFTVSSAGGRRGAQMGTFDISHPDIVDFVRAKRENGRLRQFNLSCLITADFMEAVKNDAAWDLVFPANAGEMDEDGARIVWRNWPIKSDEYTTDEQGRVACKVYKTIRARRLWDVIMASTYDYAEPGFILIDRVNEMNNNWFCENVRATNPCGEQPLPPYGACLLGSINLTRFVREPFTGKAGFDWDEFRGVVRVFTRMLDNVVEINGLPLEKQRREIMSKRRHGMGFLGLGSTLTMLRTPYGSEDSLGFTEKIAYEMARTGYETGLELAREKGVAPIMDEEFEITPEMMARRPELAEDGIRIGDRLRGRVLWARYSRYLQQFANTGKAGDAALLKQLEETGCRFTHHTSIAPTGTISLSLANNASNGIEPSFAHHYARNVIREGRKTKEKVDVYSFELLAYRELVNPKAMPFTSDEDVRLPDYFISADDVTPKQHVDIQAAAQRWVDSSISKTANVPTDFPYEDFKDIYLYAYASGLKGCTTFRFNPEAFQGVLVKEEDLANTTYRFTLDDGSTIELKGNEEVEYDGEMHTAANLFDALKEGYYGKF